MLWGINTSRMLFLNCSYHFMEDTNDTESLINYAFTLVKCIYLENCQNGNKGNNYKLFHIWKFTGKDACLKKSKSQCGFTLWSLVKLKASTYTFAQKMISLIDILLTEHL